MMEPTTPSPEQKRLTKNRYTFNVVILLILVISFTIERFGLEIMSFVSGIPKEQIGDRGIEPLQSVFIAMYKLPLAIVFCAILTTFVEKQLKPDAFGSWSKWGTIFIVLLLCFVQLAAR